MLGELVELYAIEMPDRIAALVARRVARDYAGLATLAHQMKGAAGSSTHNMAPSSINGASAEVLSAAASHADTAKIRTGM